MIWGGTFGSGPAGDAIAFDGKLFYEMRGYAPGRNLQAGQKGGIAWLLDANDGHKLQELRFDAAPVWDGIAIAHSNYFLSLKDGSVVRFSGK